VNPSQAQEHPFIDKLTKYAIIIPTHDSLTQEGFAQIFVEKVANLYGLPERIIAETRDGLLYSGDLWWNINIMEASWPFLPLITIKWMVKQKSSTR
jgi:hypothetical protein